MNITARNCRGCVTVLRGGEFIEEYRFDNGAVLRRVVRPKHIVPLTVAPGSDRASLEAAWLVGKYSKVKKRR